MSASSSHPNSKKRHVMAAVVLGTALSTLGTSSALARTSADIEAKAVRDIGRYCTACWRNARLPADCWNDCTQDVFSRLMQRIPTAAWPNVFQPEGNERQEFVRAIDAVKKRTQRRLKRDANLVNIVTDHRSQRDQRRREDRETVRQASHKVLSERQQKILQMSMEGWAVQDIATELAVSSDRVSDEKYKAIRKLRKHLKISA